MSRASRYIASHAHQGQWAVTDLRDGMVPARVVALCPPDRLRPEAAEAVAREIARHLSEVWPGYEPPQASGPMTTPPRLAADGRPLPSDWEAWDGLRKAAWLAGRTR